MLSQVRCGVIPAAGAGRRLGYLSVLLPKALFPVYDRPLLHYVIDQMQDIGIEDVYVVVNIFKEKVVSYLETMRDDFRARVHILEQPVLGGTGDAILLAEPYVGGEPFAVIYGDDCTITPSLPDMVRHFMTTEAVVTEAVIDETDLDVLRQTCSVKLGHDGRIVEILEKPANPPYAMRGCGVYMCRPEIFDHIRETPVHPVRKEREITYTISRLSTHGKAYGFKIDGHNFNVNDCDQLLKGSNMLRAMRARDAESGVLVRSLELQAVIAGSNGSPPRF
jgi:UTP--glucose-1-phosphate uridylyltransferase